MYGTGKPRAALSSSNRGGIFRTDEIQAMIAAGRGVMHRGRFLPLFAGGDGTDELTPEAIAAMTPEEVAQARENLVAEFDAAAEAGNVDRARECRDAIVALDTAVAERDAAAAQTQAEIDAMRQEIVAETDPGTTGGEDGTTTDDTTTDGTTTDDAGTDGETATTEPTETETTTTTETTTETAQPEQIAASAGPSMAEIARRRPASHAPAVVTEESPRVAITAAADVPGASAGAELTPEAVGRAFVDKVFALMGSEKGAAYPVARFRAEYPEDRALVASAGGVDQNTARITAQLERASELATQDFPAITAAGGLCAPVDASYDLTTVGSAARPVRDALTRFQADRGGVRWITPPVIGDLAAGAAVWSAANDADPNNAGATGVPVAERLATKPCVTIACGDEQVSVIDAVTLCLKIGNFSRRTFPEQFAAWYQLGLAAHARVAESRLLDRISASSVQVGDEPVVLGVARDTFDLYARLAEGYRSRNRIDDDSVLQVFLPAWLRKALILDLYKQQPGDDTFGQASASIDRAFNELRLDPTWYLDSETADAGEVSQIWPAQGAGAALGWKGEAIGYLFHPGAHLFLDGGELDLGIDIRDSALISTNDVRAFMETFEGTAFTGVESLKVTSVVSVVGSHSGPQDLIA